MNCGALPLWTSLARPLLVFANVIGHWTYATGSEKNEDAKP